MDAKSRICPTCKQQIQADANFCAYCGARFTTTYEGYCPNCHTMRDLDTSKRCAVCGGDVIDRQLRIQALDDPAKAKPGQITDYPPAGNQEVQPVHQWEKRSSRGCLGWMGRILVAVLVFLAILLAFYNLSDDFRQKIDSLWDQEIALQAPTQPAALPEEDAVPVEELVINTPSPTNPPRLDLPPIAPDSVCAGAYAYGYTCLDDAGWTSVPPEQIPDTGHPADLAACPDGVYLIASSILYGYSDGKWTNYGLYGGTTSGVIGCGAQDDLWIFDNTAAYHFAGGSFTEYVYDDIFEDVDFLSVNKVVVTAGGQVWVASNDNVVHYDGANWTLFENAADLKTSYSLTGLAIDGKGVPWVTFQDGLATYDGAKWFKIAPPSTTDVNTVYVDPAGQVWVGTDGGVSMYLDGGWQRYPIGKQAGGVTSLAVDAQQRVWVGTDYGLGVLDKGAYTFYHMSNSDLLTNDIENLVVVGRGPTLPEKIAKENGSLSGQLTEGADPVKNARVEACVQSISMFFFGATPCSDQPFMAASVTDTDGNFTIPDLPPGHYIFTAQGSDGKWKVRSDWLGVGSIYLPVQPGEDNHLGVIDLSK